MTFSANRLVGAVVYRTRKALSMNYEFIKALAAYNYAPNCLYGGKFHLWHYPGTHGEIARIMAKLSETTQGSVRKFPCIMNFLPVAETVSGSGSDVLQVKLNLAICATTSSEWLTQEREVLVFDTVLRPIYSELINQLSRTPYLLNGYGTPPHTKTEIYTTGANAGQVHDRYNEHIDAIEISNLTLTINQAACDEMYSQMADESKSVITEFL